MEIPEFGNASFETGRLSGVQRPEVDTRALEEMDPERKEGKETLEGNEKYKNTWERLKNHRIHTVLVSLNRSDLGLVPHLQLSVLRKYSK